MKKLPRSLRPSMPAGLLTSQNYWSRQEWKADGRSLGQPLCTGLIWVRLLSWIPAIPQSQQRPWTTSATCLKSERPKTTRCLGGGSERSRLTPIGGRHEVVLLFGPVEWKVDMARHAVITLAFPWL